MDLLYRAMTPAGDGGPQVGRSARRLGVRLDGERPDVTPDGENRVGPGDGGMSVAVGSMWDLPVTRLPRGMKRGASGNPKDRVYETNDAALNDRLRVHVDRPPHALVEPAERMLLDAYERAIEDTRPSWKQVWP